MFEWIQEMPIDLPEVRLTDTARLVLDRRYRWRDEKGNFLETYKQMFWRVAWVVARAYPEESRLYWARKFYEVMARMDFLPNSPAIANAGRESACYSACFVIPISDSMRGIYQCVMENALVQKNGGGVGTDFTPLRPRGTHVNGTGGDASGPVSFMRVINYSTDSVKQGALRRGANMGILSVHHPDIMEFITCKSKLEPDNLRAFCSFCRHLMEAAGLSTAALDEICDSQGNPLPDWEKELKDLLATLPPGLRASAESHMRVLLDNQFKNFNISVAITNEFMQALADAEDYNLYDHPYSPERRVVGQLSATVVWDTIARSAWESGDPGLVFIDTVNENNPLLSVKGSIVATNPCAEQPLYAYESCCLGSINVSHFVIDPDSPNDKFDFDRLRDVVRTAVRFLDGVITVNHYPLEEIARASLDTRKIGLGIMGLADTLILLGIPYNSQAGREFAAAIMAVVDTEAASESTILGKEYGPYPASARTPEPHRSAGFRNCMRTTIAPTGTISMIAGCSSGIEPLFALGYTKTVMDGTKIQMLSPAVLEYLRRMGIDADSVMNKLIETGTAKDMNWPEHLKQVLLTASELTPQDHIAMQAAIQRHVNNAVSKTVNMPHSATIEDIKSIYVMAFQQGCKGITIYRDGSKSSQVLTAPRSAKASTPVPVVYARKRPNITYGSNERMPIGCGKCYVQIFEDDMGMCEIFTTVGKNGGCASAMLQALSIVVSHALRAGMDPADIALMLRGIRCPSPALVPSQSGQVLSCPDAIGIAIQNYLSRNGTQIEVKAAKPQLHLGACPECGSSMIDGGGCNVCSVCGYSRCG